MKKNDLTPADEMGSVELNENLPVNEGTDSGEDKGEEFKWYNAEGQEVSKSAFIREQFSKLNKTRKEISDEYKIPYRTVYGATVNMENEAEPTSRGRGVTFSKIKVTQDNKVVFVKDGVVYVNGEALPEGTDAPETIEMDRNEWIKSQVESGVSRGDVAKALDLSYGVIYGLTKEAEGTRQKYEVEYTYPDGTKETVSRSEYIRRRVADGIQKGDIAKELNVEYSVVWQATKKMKTAEEKFQDCIAALEKFVDLVNNPDVLAHAITSLNQVTIKKEEADKVVDAGDADKEVK